MKNILIIGATSAIASACAKRWAGSGVHFFLVGRNPEKLEQVANDLRTRSALVETFTCDLNDCTQHATLLQESIKTLKNIDVVLIAHGVLSNQKEKEADVEKAIKDFSINAVSPISLLTHVANHLETQQQGTIIVLSSVAGERGRASHYYYCAAKAALTAFCEGLRGRLHKAGVHVLTVKPGYVDTPMTQGLALPKLLVASPEKVAKDIDNAVKSKRNVLYTPLFWFPVMSLVKLIPNSIFKKLNIG